MWEEGRASNCRVLRWDRKRKTSQFSILRSIVYINRVTISTKFCTVLKSFVFMLCVYTLQRLLVISRTTSASCSRLFQISFLSYPSFQLDAFLHFCCLWLIATQIPSYVRVFILDRTHFMLFKRCF